MKSRLHIYFILCALLSLSPIYAMDVSQYALPSGDIRTMLGSLLAEKKDIKVVTKDSSWVDFKSWHWCVGKLKTLSGIEFIVKGQNHNAHTPIPNESGGIIAEHAETQNLSRFITTEKVNALIKKHALTRVRAVKSWAYPISGNDEDLKNATDATVLVIEEMVQPAVQKGSGLNIDSTTYDQLVILAKEGKIPDLHAGNFIQDKNGTIVLIDLEDGYLKERFDLKNRHPILRLLGEYKFSQKESASAKYLIARTGLNLPNATTAILIKAHLLRLQSAYEYCIKRNCCELVGLSLAGAFSYWIYCKTRV